MIELFLTHPTGNKLYLEKEEIITRGIDIFIHKYGEAAYENIRKMVRKYTMSPNKILGKEIVKEITFIQDNLE